MKFLIVLYAFLCLLVSCKDISPDTKPKLSTNTLKNKKIKPKKRKTFTSNNQKINLILKTTKSKTSITLNNQAPKKESLPNPTETTNTSENRRYTSPILSIKRVSVKCNVTNYQSFINKPGVHKCDLTRADLWKANLQGANLKEAILVGATLTGADLREADLSEANLIYSVLASASLYESNLSDANLKRAILRAADLREANLTGANLQFANLQDADLRFAKLKEAIFTRANLTGTKVTVEQAEYLTAQGLSDFVVVKEP